MSNTPTAEEFLRALPPVLRNDRRMMALGQVVAEELSDRMSEIEKAAIYPRIDELDEALLDIHKPHDGLCHGGYTPRCSSAGVYP